MINYHFWTSEYGNLLTLPALGFFENVRTEGVLAGPRWKNILYNRKYLSILHEILYIYWIDYME